MPPNIAEYLRPNVEGNYLPIIFYNDFWLLKDKLVPVRPPESVQAALHLTRLVQRGSCVRQPGKKALIGLGRPGPLTR